jgi:hypothetical protein
VERTNREANLVGEEQAPVVERTNGTKQIKMVGLDRDLRRGEYLARINLSVHPSFSFFSNLILWLS